MSEGQADGMERGGGLEGKAERSLDDGGQSGQRREQSKPMSPFVWRLMIMLLVVIYGSFTILVHICEEDGKLPFSTSSVVLVTETLKLTVSVTMFIPEARSKGFEMPSFRFALPYAVPAVLYFINNNFGLQMQTQMDPATYQILGNMKILSTAVLYRLIIKRPITGIQWIALCMLAIAGVCNSYGGLQAEAGETSPGTIHITVLGLLMICTYCFISGLSGVYSEYILKDKYETSIHIQNSLLYIFGATLNACTWSFNVLQSNDPDKYNLFKGYSVYTWLLIISQVFCGLIMSAVMKHGNNIIRLFIISSAMLVTMVMSMVIFGLRPNVYISAAFALVLCALYLYHRK